MVWNESPMARYLQIKIKAIVEKRHKNSYLQVAHAATNCKAVRHFQLKLEGKLFLFCILITKKQVMEGTATFLRPPEISEYTINVETGRQLHLLFYKDTFIDFPIDDWQWHDIIAMEQK